MKEGKNKNMSDDIVTGGTEAISEQVKIHTLYVLDDAATKGREMFAGWYEFASIEKQTECAKILHAMGFDFVFDPNW